MLDADLVIVNGLGLEAGMEDVLEEVIADGATLIEVGPLVDPLPLGDAPDRLDPHIWMDPLRMAEAAAIIAAELAEVLPSVDWGAMADEYAAELREADAEIETILNQVEEGDRILVTNHDSLGYFADRYGFAVVASIIPGGSTLAEPSSAELAALVDVVEREQVRAIFAETTEPGALARAVAEEAGNGVAVVELFTGSLGGPGSGAETLIEMLKTNARLIADSLS
jgi:zinc/manganese transport system substrate-binding protein